MFDVGCFKSLRTTHFSIGVGNLQLGGSGKTPFVKYLLQKKVLENPAVISRGYGRKTKGFLEVLESSKSTGVGDEPLYLKQLFKKTPIYVSEKRKEAIQKLENKSYNFVFDDLFQHRWVKPNILILLTPANNLFTRDFVFPLGYLRERRVGANRADCIVVTKGDFSVLSFESVKLEIRKYAKVDIPIFFAEYRNSIPQNMAGETLAEKEEVFLVSALANNDAFLNAMKKKYSIREFKGYKDHFYYTLAEINTWPENIKILTTAKDFVKLKDICEIKLLQRIYYTDTEVNMWEENAFFEFLDFLKK